MTDSNAGMSSLRLLAEQMKELQARKEVAEESVSEINAQLDDIRLKKIPELMESLGVKNATFDGIGRVQLAADLYCSTRAGQKDVAMQWLRDCGYAEMIQETYNPGSMKALARDMIKNGVDIPEFLNVTPFIRASVVKA